MSIYKNDPRDIILSTQQENISLISMQIIMAHSYIKVNESTSKGFQSMSLLLLQLMY
jgi:hypothetical protein